VLRDTGAVVAYCENGFAGGPVGPDRDIEHGYLLIVVLDAVFQDVPDDVVQMGVCNCGCCLCQVGPDTDIVVALFERGDTRADHLGRSTRVLFTSSASSCIVLAF